MTKPVSFETASERLRLALPLMSRYHIPIAPLNYAVWYEYVAGSSPVLRDVIARFLGGDVTIVDSAVTTATNVGTMLRQAGLAAPAGRSGAISLLATDGVERFARVGARFLGAPIEAANVDLIDL